MNGGSLYSNARICIQIWQLQGVIRIKDAKLNKNFKSEEVDTTTVDWKVR